MMTWIRSVCVFWVVAMLFLGGCQSSAAPSGPSSEADFGEVVKVDNGSYRDISVSELQTMMGNKDFSLVNVHIPFEGNLPETDLSIPYDTIGQNLDKLPADKTAKIVLYCRSGSMSTIASVKLANLGYTHIFNVVGGMIAWQQAGQTIEK